jgi:pyruvate dehydrogenase E2 component (dihydrolipoamide acetyltransferase)
MPDVTMPKLSDTMTEGTLVAWKKKKGEKVSAGEVLAEIETDKATMEWESPEEGVLSEIFVPEGGKVEVGQKIAFIGEKGEAPARDEQQKTPKKGNEPVAEDKQEREPREIEEGEEQQPTEIAAETEKPAPAEAQENETAPPEAKSDVTQVSGSRAKERKTEPRTEDEGSRVKASPVARRLAGELGIDLHKVQGTGPAGRITESDVRSAAKSGPAPARAAAPGTSKTAPLQRQTSPGTRIQLSGMRRGIAERLTRSKAPVPHFYLNIDVDAGPLMQARAELKAAGDDSDTAKITVNDFVLKAAVMAAVKVPKVNASFEGEAIVQFADIDLGVAVAIEDGLLTPVIRGAQNKSLREISAAAKDLATRARNKRMKPEEFQGGSFTVSNLGGMGIDSFSAIINPPQGFILAVGAIRKVPVIDHCDGIVSGHRVSMWMSCDHRVIDGALGAQYLEELRHLLENPALLLV